MSRDIASLVRQSFEAYLKKDRSLLEPIVADDFTFTSPYDDHIDRATYFERCWPNSQGMKSFREVELIARGDVAFLLYEAAFGDKPPFRNTEFFRARDGKLVAVEVYFGSPTKDPAA